MDADSPNQGPGARALSALVLAVLLAFVAVGATAQLVNLAFGLWFSEVFLFLGLTWLGVGALGFAPGPSLGLSGFRASALGAGAALGLVNHFAWALPLMWLAQAVLPAELVERFDAAQVFERSSALETVVVALGAVLAAPACEEVFFRGLLQRGLGVHVEGPRAVVVTALVFSAFHFEPVGFLARFQLGVLFGLLAWRRGSLWPAIGAHFANNAAGTLLHFATRDLPGASEPLPGWVPLSLFVVGNALGWGLLRALPARLDALAEDGWVPGPRPRAGHVAAWAGAAAASVALLLAVDLRGVRLNLVDARTQPSRSVKARDDVRALRAQVRAGEAPLEDYEALLSSLK